MFSLLFQIALRTCVHKGRGRIDDSQSVITNSFVNEMLTDSFVFNFYKCDRKIRLINMFG